MNQQTTIHESKAMDHTRIDRVPDLALLQAGLGCKIGKQTPAPVIIKMMLGQLQLSFAQKAQILDRLAKVNGGSFAAFCIQVFISNYHLKSDKDIIEMVEALQDQIADNEEGMKRVLGNQYEFIRDVRMG